MPTPEEKRPRLSILLAVFNAERFIAPTLESILAQTYKDWELIVQDGASKDRTVEIARKYAEKNSNIKIFSEPDKGQGDAMDKALRRARGDFFIYSCASDGYLSNDWYALCMQEFDRDPELSLVWGLPFDMTEEGVLEGPHYAYARFWDKKYPPGIGMPTREISFSRKIFRRLRAKDGGSMMDWIKKINIFRLKSLGGTGAYLTPPQKQAWFWYWLETGLVFPDGNMMVAKGALLECMPPYEWEPTPDWVRFFYDFNAKGYLSMCIPIPANYAKMVSGHLGEAVRRFNLDTRNEYYAKLKKLKAQLKGNKQNMTFVDRNGNPL